MHMILSDDLYVTVAEGYGEILPELVGSLGRLHKLAESHQRREIDHPAIPQKSASVMSCCVALYCGRSKAPGE